MGLYEARMQAVQAERRCASRLTIDIPACLRTIGGDRKCRMANISDEGARLETSTPPRQGVTGWLVLGDHEIFCKVVWANETACGIRFERAIKTSTLIDIAGEQALPRGPVANAGNIQMGRKRSGLIVAGND